MSNRFIDKLNGFQTLSPGEVGALVALTAKPQLYAPKHDLIREGDKPGSVFVFLEGWACRYKILPKGSRQILAHLMPGDSCDLHVGLLDEMDHSLQTITSSSVATVSRTAMDKLFDRYPNVAKAMYFSQLIDEGTLRAWITSMGRRSSAERVAHLACELYIRAKNISLITDPPFDIPLSQSLLADSLGLTKVHINRVLQELKVGGAISLKRGTLVIEDPLRLAQVAGFDENYLHRRQWSKVASS